MIPRLTSHRPGRAAGPGTDYGYIDYIYIE
jgi:hypothetical protein